MDVLYVVGPKTNAGDLELRYSLRSLAKNLPHSRVFIAGRLPEWVKGIEHIPTEQPGSKYANALGNIKAGVADARLSEDFILMNDDFFILSPVEELKTYHRGSLRKFVMNYPMRGPYYQRLRNTLQILNGLNRSNPLIPTKPRYSLNNYELHIPMIMNKTRLAQMWEGQRGRSTRCVRTMYGNYYVLGGIEREDVKFTPSESHPLPPDFFSTANDYARTEEFRQTICSRFPEPCQYEGMHEMSRDQTDTSGNDNDSR